MYLTFYDTAGGASEGISRQQTQKQKYHRVLGGSLIAIALQGTFDLTRVCSMRLSSLKQVHETKI